MPLTRGLVTSALLLMIWSPFAAMGQTDPLTVVPSDRVATKIDNQITVTLPGNVHPMARPENDAGPVPPDYPMPHLVLVLKRDAVQQAALDELSLALQDRRSPLYHHWLRPEEFGAHFGISQGDLDQIADWLVAGGFTIDDIPSEHGTIKFSGTAAQVEAAFHTAIRFYKAPDGVHFANAADQQIPRALAGVVAGVAALHNFRPRPQATSKPRFLGGNGQHYMAPSDFYEVYDLVPLFSSGINGTGQSIAVTAGCSVNMSVVSTFRVEYLEIFQIVNVMTFGGVQPCDSYPTDDSNEVYLDTEWSGAVAPNAAILLVESSDGIYDAAYQAIHNQVAPVITTSYGDCEQNLGTAGNSAWDSLWQLAGTYGITALVSSGDTGAAGCDYPATLSSATQGLGVNGFCSSQWSICVGGTQFSDTANPSQYWSAGAGNAEGYIPELAWNASGLEPGGQDIWASGGGYSTLYATPLWQAGNTGTQRGVPDVALSAAAHDGYVFCPNIVDCGYGADNFWVTYGTSAAAPSFAGIMALVVQETGQWQGSAGSVLYGLAQNSSLNVFHDVISGNNSVPGQQGYPAGPGWDPVTGLGSVDANALVTNWPGAAPVSLSTGQLHFRNQVVGTSSAAQSVTIVNNASSGLGISQLTLTGANPGDFPMATTCAASLAPGGTCTVTLTFQPTAPGSRIAVVSIADSAGNSPQTVQLAGTGVSAASLNVTDPEVSIRWPQGGCTAPPAVTSFPTSDRNVYSFFSATVTGSDNLTSDWLAPNGDVISGFDWGMAIAGPDCFTNLDGLYIEDAPAAYLGVWQARVYDNGELLFTVPFLVNSPATIHSSALQFRTVAPCRVIDTRNPNGTFGGPFIAGGTSRTIPIPSSPCGLPANAMAWSLNFTVVPRTGTLGSLTVWPIGQPQPNVLTLTSPDGSVLANAALVPAGTGGSISAYSTDDTDLVVDINGYFVPPATGTLQFFPLPPCRVLDTRNPNGTFGGPSLAAGSGRSLPIRSSSCGAPANADAYSLNVTVVPQGPLGYLTAWPTGQTQPFVSTMNSYYGTVIANAAIVPAGTGGGAVSFFASNTTDLVVDIDGYFAPPGSGGLNFYTVPPCRLADTRFPYGYGSIGSGAIGADTTRDFPLSQASCGLPAYPAAQAYSLTMTVIPQGVLGYLSTWPTGGPQPVVSTLNAWKGLAVANAALVPSGTSSSISVFVTNATDLTIDTAGYFGP